MRAILLEAVMAGTANPLKVDKNGVHDATDNAIGKRQRCDGSTLSISEVQVMSELITDTTPPDLIAAIARALVDKPGEVSINETSNEFGETLYLRVHPSDVRLVIGKEGRTARSPRTILGAVSVQLKHRYSLEIVDGYLADQDSEKK